MLIQPRLARIKQLQVAVVGDVTSFIKYIMDKDASMDKGNTKSLMIIKWLKHVNETKDYWRENLKIHPGEMSAAKILTKIA